MLKAIYKVRNGFGIVRSPLIESYEYPEDMRDHQGALKREYRHEGTKRVYEARWKYLADAFQELEEQNLDAQVEWGSEFRQTIIPLRKCRAQLKYAIESMLDREKNPEDYEDMTAEDKAEERSILYESGEDSDFDKLTPQINIAIKQFEDKLRPLIKG